MQMARDRQLARLARNAQTSHQAHRADDIRLSPGIQVHKRERLCRTRPTILQATYPSVDWEHSANPGNGDYRGDLCGQ